jgi:hypothetical protein
MIANAASLPKIIILNTAIEIGYVAYFKKY